MLKRRELERFVSGLGFFTRNKSAHDRYPEGVEEDAAGENDLP
jgi:hypothetical protein